LPASSSSSAAWTWFAPFYASREDIWLGTGPPPKFSSRGGRQLDRRDPAQARGRPWRRRRSRGRDGVFADLESEPPLTTPPPTAPRQLGRGDRRWMFNRPDVGA
jgi:hypothetical protein